MLFDFDRGEMLLIDKPLDWTSFDVVNYMRKTITKYLNHNIKVGHAGTLDPKATGLLIVLTGKKTKLMGELLNLNKEYVGTMKLGETTPSYDRELDIDNTYPFEHISENDIYALAKKFIGRQEQYPPVYSAVKIDGKRAYEYARENLDVVINPRFINIYEFEITKIDLPYIDFRVVCSSGTFIRSIVRDFGFLLDSGAVLENLRRTKIGDYSVTDAHDPRLLNDLLEQFH
ncbi:MAG TPA: tRNA pseudouridine(55) synthase TruB [Bacteroidales bacterium]|nr:tRNA pseudouridine(55) synthase TruB [Bacteroidales bacterium]HOH93621.1 tRNA pseudouridine(55) synthase TruB [Bacteroidales bacterium]